MHVINLNQNFCEVVAKQLLQRFTIGKFADFSKVLIIVPSHVAENSLLCQLEEQAQKSKIKFCLPKILTIQTFFDFIIENYTDNKIASKNDEVIAWLTALSNIEFKDSIYAKKDFNSSLKSVTTLQALYQTLTAELKTPQDILNLNDCSELEIEYERWILIAKIFEEYHNILKNNGLIDRLQALKNIIEKPEKLNDFQEYITIISVGVCDARQLYYELLRVLNAQIFCAGNANWFDNFGKLIVNFEKEFELSPKLSEKLYIMKNAEEQAFCVMKLLEKSQNNKLENIIIGVPDDEVLEQLKNHLIETKIPFHNAKRISISNSELGSFILLLENFLTNEKIQDFVALLRHPYSINKYDITEFDINQLINLAYKNVIQIIGGLENNLPNKFLKLYFDLYKNFNVNLKINDWIKFFDDFIFSLQKDSEIITDLDQKINELWYDWVDLHYNSKLIYSKEISAIEFLRYVKNNFLKSEVSLPQKHKAIRLNGWLDLLFAQANFMIITGFNDGIIPETVSQQAFLTNTICEKLGIKNNEQRLNRDKYIMQVLIKSIPNLFLICSKYNMDGSAKLPTRLLFDCADHEIINLANLFYGVDSQKYFDEANVQSNSSVISLKKAPIYEVPIPQFSVAPTTVSISSFNDYNECPYRFYLKKQNIKNLKPFVEELDTVQYGTLFHEIINELCHKIKPDHELQQIEAIVNLQLKKAKYNFENKCQAAVLQLDSLKKRLVKTLEYQVEHCKKYEILETELNVELELNNIKICGRIDRIDRLINCSGNQKYLIIDYKTSEKNIKDIITRNTIKDFQLLIYAMAFQNLKSVEFNDLEIGYFSVSSELDKIELSKMNLLSFLSEKNIAEEGLKNFISNFLDEMCSTDIKKFERKPSNKNCKYCDYKRLCKVDYE